MSNRKTPDYLAPILMAAGGLVVYVVAKNLLDSSQGSQGSSVPLPVPSPAPPIGPAPQPAPVGTPLPPMDPFEEAPPPPEVLPISATSEDAINQSKVVAKAVLNAARKDLGQTEVTENASPRIDQMLATVGTSSPNPWCAAAASTWIKSGFSKLGFQLPLEILPANSVLGRGYKDGGGNANNLRTQFQDPLSVDLEKDFRSDEQKQAMASLTGWVSGDEIRQNPALLEPGMVVFWAAHTRSPTVAHMGLVEQRINDTTYGTIEGNSGVDDNAVARGRRKYADPKLLGAGYFSKKLDEMTA